MKKKIHKVRIVHKKKPLKKKTAPREPAFVIPPRAFARYQIDHALRALRMGLWRMALEMLVELREYRLANKFWDCV